MQFRRDCSCTEDLKRQEHVGNFSGDILRHRRTACVCRAGHAPHILFVSVAAWHIFKAFETHRPTHYRILSRTTDLRRSPLVPTITKCDENDQKNPKSGDNLPSKPSSSHPHKTWHDFLCQMCVRMLRKIASFASFLHSGVNFLTMRQRPIGANAQLWPWARK